MPGTFSEGYLAPFLHACRTMGRLPRNFPAGTIVHAYNRGAERRTIFTEDADYVAFIDVMREGLEKDLVRIFGYCVMPNHWHFVLQAAIDNGISRFMHWLTNTHVKRYRKFRANIGEGHLYQDRFKSPVIEGEEHFLTTMRYVEANAAVAGLVKKADYCDGARHPRVSYHCHGARHPRVY